MWKSLSWLLGLSDDDDQDEPLSPASEGPKLINWAFVGLGESAWDMGTSVASLPDCQVARVTNASKADSQRFCTQFGGYFEEQGHGASRGEGGVDVAYVSGPLINRSPLCREALGRGWNVVVESPLAMNEREADGIARMAAQAELFLMEALPGRFGPASRKLDEMIALGRIGEIGMVRLDCSHKPSPEEEGGPSHPLWGGALLPQGGWAVGMAVQLYGEPKEQAVAAVGAVDPNSHLDTQVSISLCFSPCHLASICCSTAVDLPGEAHIYGSAGSIIIADPFWFPPSITVNSTGYSPQSFFFGLPGNDPQADLADLQSTITSDTDAGPEIGAGNGLGGREDHPNGISPDQGEGKGMGMPGEISRSSSLDTGMPTGILGRGSGVEGESKKYFRTESHVSLDGSFSGWVREVAELSSAGESVATTPRQWEGRSVEGSGSVTPSEEWGEGSGEGRGVEEVDFGRGGMGGSDEDTVCWRSDGAKLEIKESGMTDGGGLSEDEVWNRFQVWPGRERYSSTRVEDVVVRRRACYKHIVMEVNRCLKEGSLESHTLPISESLSILRIMDTVRAHIGLEYDLEKGHTRIPSMSDWGHQ